MNDRLVDQEDQYIDVVKIRKKLESENDDLKKNIQKLDIIIKKKDNEKQSKDQQLRSLQVILIFNFFLNIFYVI